MPIVSPRHRTYTPYNLKVTNYNVLLIHLSVFHFCFLVFTMNYYICY